MKKILFYLLLILSMNVSGQFAKFGGLTTVPTYSIYYNRTDSLPALYKGTTDLWNYLITPNYANKTYLRVNQQYPQSIINGSPVMEGIQFDTTPTTTNVSEGLLRWNATDGTLDLGQGAAGIVTQQIGQELFIKVTNRTGTTISEGKAVYFIGRQGTRPKIKLAIASADSTSHVVGIVTEDIAHNGEGYITTFGYVRKIKTDYATWAEGQQLYLSATTAGDLTNVEPTAPHHADIIGSIGVVHSTQGSIFIDVQKHKDLTNLSDVNGTALTTSGQLPIWNQTAGYFDFTGNINDYLPLTAITATNHYTGFPNRDSTALAFDDGTYTFRLAATDDNIWINGVIYEIDTLTKQLSVAQEAVSGTYYFWLTQTAGVVSLNCDIAFPGFDKCLTATVYWNTALNKGIISDERHWMGRDKWLHEYLHETIGSRYANGLTGTFGNTTFSITAGEIYDEDLEHEIDVTTTAKVMYHNGSDAWDWDVTTTPNKVTAGNLNYNSGTTLATADNNKYVNYFVFANGDVAHPIHIFIGTAQYTTLDLARAAPIPSLGSLTSAENKLIYKIIYKNTTGGVFQEAIDYREASSIP